MDASEELAGANPVSTQLHLLFPQLFHMVKRHTAFM